jgi:ABC-type lipoprotein export system ATPase subunit
MDCKAVVGIYGVSGCGKSRLLSLLQAAHPEWRCLEGSSVIRSILEQNGEGLKDFHARLNLKRTRFVIMPSR